MGGCVDDGGVFEDAVGVEEPGLTTSELFCKDANTSRMLTASGGKVGSKASVVLLDAAVLEDVVAMIYSNV